MTFPVEAARNWELFRTEYNAALREWKTFTGSETQQYIPYMLTFVNQGMISLSRLVGLISENPTKLMNIFPKKGALLPGSDADIVLLDMQRKKVLKDDDRYPRCGWTVYDDTEVQGVPVMTIVRGTIVMEDGQVNGKPSYREFVGPSSRVAVPS